MFNFLNKNRVISVSDFLEDIDIFNTPLIVRTKLPNEKVEVVGLSCIRDTGNERVSKSNISRILKNGLFNIIFDNIKENGKKHFLDLRNDNILFSQWNTDTRIFNYLLSISNEYDFIISNQRLAHYLNRNDKFIKCDFSNKDGDISSTGQFLLRYNFVNFNAKYSDTSIIIGDCIHLEIIDIKESEIKEKYNVRLYFRYKVLNPRVLYVFTDEYNDGIDIMKSEKRKDKIDYILNEGSGSR